MLCNKLKHHEKEIDRQKTCKILREAIPPILNYNKAGGIVKKLLKEDPDILILQADKGNATIIINTK